MDSDKITAWVRICKPRMTKFLRAMIAVRSESREDEDVIKRIRHEMESLWYGRIEIDNMGNIIGYLGDGLRLIAFDGHADTVGQRYNWIFSTNGVSIMGMSGISVVGFGPGREKEAHVPDEKTWKEDLVRYAVLYAALPATYAAKK